MLGLRSRPSSRSVNEALSLLNAVGGDTAKTKILEEIRKAQEAYEKIFQQSKEEQKRAENALQEAKTEQKAVEASRLRSVKAQTDAEAKIEVLREGLNRRIEDVSKKENVLEARIRGFDEKMKSESLALEERVKTVSRLEAEKAATAALMTIAETMKRDYEKKLAKLKDIVSE